MKDYWELEPKLPNPKWFIIAFLVALLLVMGITCAKAETLKASWYSIESLKQEGTYRYSKGVMANGKLFKDDNLTCACRLYNLGDILLITNISNGKSINVVVTDRIGKRFAKTRIDLSKGAFKQIANLKQGLINIKVVKLN